MYKLKTNAVLNLNFNFVLDVSWFLWTTLMGLHVVLHPCCMRYLTQLKPPWPRSLQWKHQYKYPHCMHFISTYYLQYSSLALIILSWKNENSFVALVCGENHVWAEPLKRAAAIHTLTINSRKEIMREFYRFFYQTEKQLFENHLLGLCCPSVIIMTMTWL